MFHFSEAENTQDRIPEVHQTILKRLGHSLTGFLIISGQFMDRITAVILTLILPFLTGA